MAKAGTVKAKARTLFEAGESLRDIAAKVGKHYQTVMAWSKKEGWKAGILRPVLDQKERDSAIAACERAGLTRGLVAETAVKLMKAKDVLMVGPEGQIFRHPAPDHAVMKKDSAGRLVAPVLGVDYEIVEDRRAMKDGAVLGTDILGMKKADQEAERANDNLLNLIRSMRPK